MTSARGAFPLHRLFLMTGFATLTAWGAPPPSPAAHALAPGQPDYLQHRRALEEHLSAADAVGTALMRVHNALAPLMTEKAGPSTCDAERTRSLLARTRPLGAAYRDAAQAARSEAARFRAIFTAPTLAPLLQEEDRRAAEALLARSNLHVREYLEASAWQQRFVEPLLQRCGAKLATAEGLPAPGPLLEHEWVAVIATGGGRVCPGNFPADGRVLLLHDPKACYGGPECACEPRPLLPAAVLGPPAASAP